MKFLALFAFAVLSACARTPVPAPTTTTASDSCQSPFVGVESSEASPEDRKILKEAAEDFCAVVAGKKPIHATLDEQADLPADGGTTFYIGQKYRLTVLQSMSSFGGFFGHARGPILSFDDSFAPGNTNVISSIRVYAAPMAPVPEQGADGL